MGLYNFRMNLTKPFAAGREGVATIVRIVVAVSATDLRWSRERAIASRPDSDLLA